MTNLNLPIYLDYASTTPADKRVAQKIYEHLTLEGNFGNPAFDPMLMDGQQKNPLKKREHM